MVHTGRPKRLSTVLSHDQALAVINRMTGKTYRMARVLFGSGSRLVEGLRLRVTDFDFSYHRMPSIIQMFITYLNGVNSYG